MAYKSNSSKFWTGFLAVLLALVLAGTAALIGVLSNGFKNWDKFKIDDEQTEQTEEQKDNGAPVMDENGEELKSNAPIAMPKAMTFRSASVLDGAEAQYASIVLHATVKPNIANNQAVDWSVVFVNPSSEWASGKTVTDYVTVTPESDGSTTATVQCLKDFGEQIKVIVASRDNVEVKAECTVDFQKRLFDITFTSNDDISVSENEKLFTVLTNNRFGEIGQGDCTFVYSAYTVDSQITFDLSCSASITQPFLDALSSSNLVVEEDVSYVYSSATDSFSPFLLGSFWLSASDQDCIYSGVPVRYLNEYILVLQSMGENILGNITFKVVQASFEKTYSVKFVSSALKFFVEEVELDNDKIVI